MFTLNLLRGSVSIDAWKMIADNPKIRNNWTGNEADFSVCFEFLSWYTESAGGLLNPSTS